MYAVIGDEDDPMTAKRKDILQPLAQDINTVMKSIFGEGQGAIEPYKTPPQAYAIQQFSFWKKACKPIARM